MFKNAPISTTAAANNLSLQGLLPIGLYGELDKLPFLIDPWPRTLNRLETRQTTLIDPIAEDPQQA